MEAKVNRGGWMLFGPAILAVFGSCIVRTPGRPCADECSGEDSAECTGGNLRTCVVGVSGCLRWGEPVRCEAGFCADDSACGICTHDCDPAPDHTCVGDSVRRCILYGKACQRLEREPCPTGCWDGVCNIPFTALTSGTFHTCGPTTDGTAVCWGDNQSRQSMPPAPTYTALEAGGRHTCGISVSTPSRFR